MEPFEQLLSLQAPDHWMLDSISWQTITSTNPLANQSSQSLYCNPADLLLRTSSAPPPTSHSTPEPDGPGVHRTASTRIRTARRPNVTKGPPDMAPPERPVSSLEGRTTASGRTARKHKLYLSVSTYHQWRDIRPGPRSLALTPQSFLQSLDLDRPHVCRYCRARFDRPGDCERHVRAHEKDQEFWCHNPQCPASPEYRIFYRAGTSPSPRAQDRISLVNKPRLSDARQRHWQRHVECWDWWYSTPEGRTYYELHKKKITHLPPSILAELAARGEAPPKPRARRSISVCEKPPTLDAEELIWRSWAALVFTGVCRLLSCPPMGR